MPMQLTYGLQHSMAISLQFMNLFSFCFDCTTDQESLGSPLKDLALYNCLYHKSRSSLHVARSKFTQKCRMVQIFVVFIFACRTHMQNMQKLAPCENFPLYSIAENFCWTKILPNSVNLVLRKYFTE